MNSKHPGGRPLKFKTAKEIEDLAEAYFSSTPITQWTITGLAMALDTTRRTLVDYDEREEFSHTIKKIKTKVEHSYELTLRSRGGSGDIFGLKNFGWADRQEVEHSGGDPIKVLLDKFGVTEEVDNDRQSDGPVSGSSKSST